jgi:hypothetical protein
MRWDVMGFVGLPLVRHTTRPDSYTTGSGGGGSGAVRCDVAGWADLRVPTYLPTYLPTHLCREVGRGGVMGRESL